ncbi:tricarballylate utilization 4Fe-4S protein TcuB [Chelativorans sp. YIM 93263]|uniref:tricarballylate utilization 4Fe-4S protein TcuB n=1 Tax=Chelativorans sp. YIM 93263 TaxID=2906648 RepID=UPI00237883C8|nr:tricarballylate utilization 4Fe-4S protein TcuB [Chelativorans sp. YIM 93263]
MQATSHITEAERLMTICNSCRYCEGLCAVFPAMEMRRAFSSGDLNYLANLCHGCGACYVDCQFAPPHEFDVNVPKVLAQVRNDSYRSYAWPAFLQPMFDRNGLAIALVTALSIAAFILGFALWHEPGVLFAETGNFYRVMPHTTMVTIFGAAALFALFALTMGYRAFWKDIGASGRSANDAPSLWQAMKDAGSLRYLDGGGVGCYNENERPTDNRRIYHHLTFYGFLLCFAATTSGTLLHYFMDMPAPYAWYQLPKLLGTAGGIGLAIGPIGLLKAKFARDPDLVDTSRLGMDTAFTVMLFLTGVSGLLLMLLRVTPAMGLLLALHLGFVFALFLTLPYSKFVHGLYRFGALVHYAMERRFGI